MQGKIAMTAQQTISYKSMLPDGICKVTDNFYTKTLQFFDINYQLSECSNKGTIDAKKYVGGIVGQHRVGYEITACGNFGDIVCSSNSYAGGIVGEVIRTTSSLTVSKCYNTGTVDGSGIIGYSGGTFTSGSENSRIIVKDCYNTGVVDVGGIIGSAFRNDVESCYNAGSSSAAIVSSNTNSSVTNCYYLSTSATNSTHGGTSLTKEQMTDDTSWKTHFAGFDTNIWSKPTNDDETLYLPKLDDYSPFLYIGNTHNWIYKLDGTDTIKATCTDTFFDKHAF